MRRSYAALALLLACAIPYSAASACLLISGHGFRRPEATHLIALPTKRTLSAARAIPPHLAKLRPAPTQIDRISARREWWWWKARAAQWRRRAGDVFRPSLPYGQVVSLERVGGAHTGRIRDALRLSRGEAVLVYWGVGDECGNALNESRGPWLEPGVRVFTAAQLRAERGWVGGRPTFDVVKFDLLHANWEAPTDPRGRPVARMRLADYWGLYESLPTRAQLRRDTAAALAPMRAWVRAHPGFREHPVVRGVIMHTEAQR